MKTALFVVLSSACVWAHSAGPDPRYTAAPGDDQRACATAGCHTSSPGGGPINNFSTGGVTATFSSSTYTPGQVITITVNVTDPTNRQFGFQMTARLESNLSRDQAGTFTPGTGSFVLCDNNLVRRTACSATSPIEFIEHSSPRSSAVTFTWTAPTSGNTTVRFYVAGNAVNGNGNSDGGDHVYTASYTLPAAGAGATVTSVTSGTDFGGYSNFASGSWLEIKGTNLASNTRIWGGADFAGTTAPSKLDGTSVTINGKAATVYYISPTQVNVNAPADTATGPVQIEVTNGSGQKASISSTKVGAAPGLLAPAAFKVNGTQYLVAQFADQFYVGNTGLIPGVAFRPAKPGDSITIYGIGFGDVTPSIPSGTVVTQLNSLTAPLTFKFGSTDATVTYKGLAPNFVGLYQFNVTVPNVPDGDSQINVTLGGTALAQSPFFLTVKK